MDDRPRMPAAIRRYVRTVDAVGHAVGRFAMYLIFAMLGILLYSSISRTVFDVPLIWVVEMAQFTMAAYYILGGAYSMQLDSHVRMDLLYTRWSPRTRSLVDMVTILCLVFYLAVLLVGAVSSTVYALEYGQTNYSTWAPPLAPIKIVMTAGIALVLLQAIAMFFKDLAVVTGRSLA